MDRKLDRWMHWVMRHMVRVRDGLVERWMMINGEEVNGELNRWTVDGLGRRRDR